MMWKWIQPTTDFRDSGQQYYALELRKVNEMKAAYFGGMGWAIEVPAPQGAQAARSAPREVVLQVHDVVETHQSERVG